MAALTTGHQISESTGNWAEMLELVLPEWHDAFRHFIETGEADENFLDYLNDSERGQQAVEMAFTRQAQGFEQLAAELKNQSAETPEDVEFLRTLSAISNGVAAVVEAALQTSPQNRDEVIQRNTAELAASMPAKDRNALTQVVKSLDNNLTKVAASD